MINAAATPQLPTFDEGEGLPLPSPGVLPKFEWKNPNTSLPFMKEEEDSKPLTAPDESRAVTPPLEIHAVKVTRVKDDSEGKVRTPAPNNDTTVRVLLLTPPPLSLVAASWGPSRRRTPHPAPHQRHPRLRPGVHRPR